MPCSLSALWRARSSSAYLPCAPALAPMLAASASHAWCADLLHDRHALHGGGLGQGRRLPKRFAWERSALRVSLTVARWFACSMQDSARFTLQLCLAAGFTCRLCAAAAVPPPGTSSATMRWQSRAACRMRAVSIGHRVSPSATCLTMLCRVRKLRSISSSALTWRRARCAGFIIPPLLHRRWCHHQAVLLYHHPLLQACPERPGRQLPAY